MRIYSFWIGFLVAMAIGSGASATPPIATDRPDFTESSWNLPPGRLQVESGFTLLRERDGVRSLRLPETLLRLGIAERWEMRLGLPIWRRETGAGPVSAGFDDTYLGAKYRIGPLRGIHLALIPAVFVPTGAGSVSSVPEMKLVWSRDLPAGRSLSGMLYGAFPLEEGARRGRWQHTVSVGAPLAERVGAFVEGVTDFGRGQSAASTLHGGLTFQPDPSRQWDIHGGKGLNRGAPSWFIAAGYSIRLGDPR